MTITKLDYDLVEVTDAPASEQTAVEFYQTYRARLQHYVIRHFGPRDADEVTQETLVRAVTTIDLDRPEYESWAWLTMVARNLSIDLARRRAKCEVSADGGVMYDVDAAPDDPELVAIRNAEHTLVRQAFDRVPQCQRRV